jgi:hypothetical protein
MECIDRKFKIAATSLKSGKKYSQSNSILFLVKDALLPDLLDKYLELASQRGADERQLKGIGLLKDRVIAWQRMHSKDVHLPDVEEGKEEKRVCKENNC